MCLKKRYTYTDHLHMLQGVEELYERLKHH